MQVLEGNYFDFGKFRLDKANKVLRYENELISLPLKSVELLCFLIERRGEVVSKKEILDNVWGDAFVEESVLTQNIYTLRKTFEEFGEKGLIKTVPRRGYVFSYENTQENALVIEREIYEEIEVIESEAETETKPVLALPEAKTKNFAFKYVLLVAATIVLAVTGIFGYLLWKKDGEKKSLSQIKSIAILPIKSLGDKEEEKILALGLRDKIASSIGSLKSLQVLTSELSESEIEELKKFDAVLLGTLQKNGEKVRVNLRLLRTSDAVQLWTGSFDELQSDFFQLQDEISSEIAKSLSLNLSKEDREIVFRHGTENKEAYANYLQGRYFFSQRGLAYSSSLDKARTFFERAVELDPNFAEANVGLADVINLQTDQFNKLNPKFDEGYQKSKQLISKALEINPNLAEAHAAQGWIYQRYEWNFEESEKSFLKAIELNPNLTNAYIWLSVTYYSQGKTDIAVKYAEKAIESEPTLERAYSNLAANYAFNNQCDKTVELLPRLAKYHTSLVPKNNEQGLYLGYCGKCSEAIPLLEESRNQGGKGLILVYMLGYCYAATNQPEKARAELKTLEASPDSGHSILGRILIHSNLGEKEKALEILSKYYQSKVFRLSKIAVDPRLKAIQSEPRFKEIVRVLSLE